VAPHDTRGVRFHLKWRGVQARPGGRTRQTSIALHWLWKRTQVLEPAPVHPDIKAGERFLRYRPLWNHRMRWTRCRKWAMLSRKTRSGGLSLSLPPTSGRMNRKSGQGSGGKPTSRLIICDTLVTFCRFHLGRGREVPSQPLFYESVKTCMKNPLLNYSPRARYKNGTETFVP
jgi:hypothetical protein